MIRSAAVLFCALLLCVPFRPALAQNPCGDLIDQIASQDQELDRAKADAVPWLHQASLAGLVVGGELASVATLGEVPALTLELANADGALAAQVATEMDLSAANVDAADSGEFAGGLANRLLDWQARLAGLQPFAAYSAGLTSMVADIQTLNQISARSQAALALRDSLNQSLIACQAGNGGLPALGCGLTYFGLDRSGAQPVLRPAVPSLPAGAQVGMQWENTLSQSADQSGMVDIVDSYTCTSDGATKVGRIAVQTFPDGSTTTWGERNYIGTLWPKTITPGASWQWHTVQFSSDPAGVESDYEETFNVTVTDAGREMLVLPQGKFEAIHLHYEEDVIQPSGETPHFSWDEWYARPA